jgi:Spy/CpxP family protein refolding chaperone
MNLIYPTKRWSTRIFLGLAYALLGCVPCQLHAQQLTRPNSGNVQGSQRVEALKRGYLNQQLDLSPEQAKKFWPLYNQYQQDMKQLARKRRENQMGQTGSRQSNDRQIEKSMDKDFNIDEKALQTREHYRDQFRQVMPPRKVMQFYKAEKDFNQQLIEELHRRRSQANPSRPPQRSGNMRSHSPRR